MSKPSQTRLANSRKALIGSSVAALGYALLASAPAAAAPSGASADASIIFRSATPNPDAVLIQINGVDPRPLGYNFTLDSSLPGYTWNGTTVQNTYNTSSVADLQIDATVTTSPGAGGIVKQLSSWGVIPDPADISLNTIIANAYGNNALPAAGSVSFDLGLLSTNDTAGTLIVQYTGNDQVDDKGVSVTSALSNQFVGVDYARQVATELAVNGNQLAAQTALNTATTLVAGAVPLGYTNTSTGGSSTITLAGGVSGASSAGIGINTLQVSQDSGISNGTSGSGSYAGSYAIVTGSSIAVEANASNSSLTAPITLNSNDIAAQFTGNSANNVFESNSAAGSPTNAFNGTVAITNAQANVESIPLFAPAGVNAQVSSSSILADLTYDGVSSGSGYDTTTLTGSLAVSGTADNAQTITASANGNLAGSVTSTGGLAYYGNAITFADGTVDLTGKTGSASGVSGSATTGISNASGDLVVNNGQANLGGAGVAATVSGSSVRAAVDVLSASGTITAEYNEVSGQVAGNAAGNLIDVAATNADGRMAVAGMQINSASGVTALAQDSGVTVGVGNFSSGSYAVSDRVYYTDVSGSITSNNNLLAATAQGNLGANTIQVAAGNTLDAAQSGSTATSATSTTVNANAGLAAGNVQDNLGSAVVATVSGGGIKVDIADQAGWNAGLLAELGAANVVLSDNTTAAQAQGNTGFTTVSATGSTLDLTAGVANAQRNSGVSAITAQVTGSDIRVSEQRP